MYSDVTIQKLTLCLSSPSLQVHLTEGISEKQCHFSKQDRKCFVVMPALR